MHKFIFVVSALALLPACHPPPMPACRFDGVALEFQHDRDVYKEPVELIMSFEAPPLAEADPLECRWRCPESGIGSTVSGFFFCPWRSTCPRNNVSARIYWAPNWQVGVAHTVERDAARCSDQIFEIDRFIPLSHS